MVDISFGLVAGAIVEHSTTENKKIFSKL